MNKRKFWFAVQIVFETIEDYAESIAIYAYDKRCEAVDKWFQGQLEFAKKFNRAPAPSAATEEEQK